MASITITFDTKAVQDGLRRVSKRLDDLRPVFEDIGEYIEGTVENRFTRMVGPDGRPWKRLKKSTIAAKRNKSRILIEDGHMAESLGRNVHNDRLEVGFSDRKAVWHQFGTKPYTIRPKRKRVLAFVGANSKRVFTTFVNHPGLPARPMLGINRKDRGAINRIMQRHIDREWEG